MKETSLHNPARTFIVRACPISRVRFIGATARMAKSVDAGDLKSLGRKAVPVRVRLRAPVISGLTAPLAIRCASRGIELLFLAPTLKGNT